MCEIKNHVPRTMQEFVGNQSAKEKIETAKKKNGGRHGGLAYFISGDTGSGKTTLAEAICREIDPDRCDPILDVGQSVFRPLCNREDETTKTVDRMLDAMVRCPMWSNGIVFVFDECDRLSSGAMSEIKQVLDRLHAINASNRGKQCAMTVILTTSKAREDLPAEKRKHWDELRDRCVRVFTEIEASEFDAYFKRVSGGVIDHMSENIDTLSFRQAWDFIDDTNVEVHAA